MKMFIGFIRLTIKWDGSLKTVTNFRDGKWGESHWLAKQLSVSPRRISAMHLTSSFRCIHMCQTVQACYPDQLNCSKLLPDPRATLILFPQRLTDKSNRPSNPPQKIAQLGKSTRGEENAKQSTKQTWSYTLNGIYLQTIGAILPACSYSLFHAEICFWTKKLIVRYVVRWPIAAQTSLYKFFCNIFFLKIRWYFDVYPGIATINNRFRTW
jgi:hypothetical protein